VDHNKVCGRNFDKLKIDLLTCIVMLIYFKSFVINKKKRRCKDCIKVIRQQERGERVYCPVSAACGVWYYL
jgi:hypothetical protein